MIECPFCYHPITNQVYQPEWSDIPTKIIYSCVYGCTTYSRPLTNEEEQQYIEMLIEEEENEYKAVD